MFVLNNAITAGGESQQTRRTLGWGIDMQDWDTGVLAGNVFIGTDNPAVTNTYSWKLMGHTRDVSINHNVSFNSSSSGETTAKAVLFKEDYDGSIQNVSHHNNWIQNYSSTGEMLIDETTSV